MLQLTLRSWANLLLTTVIFLPILASAKASKEKAIDISIIEQSDSLIPHDDLAENTISQTRGCD